MLARDRETPQPNASAAATSYQRNRVGTRRFVMNQNTATDSMASADARDSLISTAQPKNTSTR